MIHVRAWSFFRQINLNKMINYFNINITDLTVNFSKLFLPRKQGKHIKPHEHIHTKQKQNQSCRKEYR